MSVQMLLPAWLSRSSIHDDPSTTTVGHVMKLPNIWHVIYWLYMHRTYYRVGIVLGEYCLKMLLSHMESKEASVYKRAFKRMGINIDQLTFGSIVNAFFGIGSERGDGEKGLFFSLYNAPFWDFNLFFHIIETIHDTERNIWKLLVSDIGTPIRDLRGLIEKLFERIILLARFPSSSSYLRLGLDDVKLQAMHTKFAEYLLSLDKEWRNKEAIIEESRKIYEGSHWLDVGLSAIETKFEEKYLMHPNGPKPTVKEVSGWLDVEHKHWQHWSLSFVDIIDRLKPEILNEIQKAESMMHSFSSKKI